MALTLTLKLAFVKSLAAHVRPHVSNEALGVLAGTFFCLSLAVMSEVTLFLRMLTGVVFGIILAFVLGMTAGTSNGIMGSTTSSIVISVIFLVAYFRLPLYLIQILLSLALSRIDFRNKGTRLWFFSPPAWDELIWFPLPGLDVQLIDIVRENREVGLECIAYTSASFNQGWAAKNAILSLIANDIVAAKDLRAIANISNTLSWLPQNNREELKNTLLGLDEISRRAFASIESETTYNRQEQLRLGLNLIENVQKGLVLTAK